MSFRSFKTGLTSYLQQCVLFLYRHAGDRHTIQKDLYRWQSILGQPPDDVSLRKILLFLFENFREYRNLFYFRLRNDPIRNHFIFSLTYRLYPPKDSLVIFVEEDIGPGLFIQHGTATGIAVRRIGTNCWINHHVALGYTDVNQSAPAIGNNVIIFAGAKIYGDITINDNVIIGANAVVVKDVPPNCTIAGVPGRIIRRNGVRVDEPL